MAENVKRRVGAGFGFLIFLLPMPLALMTLRTGYSTTVRVLSIGWLVLAALLTAGYFSN